MTHEDHIAQLTAQHQQHQQDCKNSDNVANTIAQAVLQHCDTGTGINISSSVVSGRHYISFIHNGTEILVQIDTSDSAKI